MLELTFSVHRGRINIYGYMTSLIPVVTTPTSYSDLFGFKSGPVRPIILVYLDQYHHNKTYRRNNLPPTQAYRLSSYLSRLSSEITVSVQLAIRQSRRGQAGIVTESPPPPENNGSSW